MNVRLVDASDRTSAPKSSTRKVARNLCTSPQLKGTFRFRPTNHLTVDSAAKNPAEPTEALIIASLHVGATAERNCFYKALCETEVSSKMPIRCLRVLRARLCRTAKSYQKCLPGPTHSDTGTLPHLLVFCLFQKHDAGNQFIPKTPAACWDWDLGPRLAQRGARASGFEYRYVHV